jgi:hypothetical protein
MGYVYVLSNPSWGQHTFKIGSTKANPFWRARQLGTNLPHVTSVEAAYIHEQENNIERFVHLCLARYRVSRRREFFECSLARIRQVIAEQINSIRPTGDDTTRMREYWSRIDAEEFWKTLQMSYDPMKMGLKYNRIARDIPKTSPEHVWAMNEEANRTIREFTDHIFEFASTYNCHCYIHQIVPGVKRSPGYPTERYICIDIFSTTYVAFYPLWISTYFDFRGFAYPNMPFDYIFSDVSRRETEILHMVK